MSKTSESQLFVKSLTAIQRQDYSTALERHFTAGKKTAEATELAQAEMLASYPIIQQQMEGSRPKPVPKVKKPPKPVVQADFIRDIHWVYDTMGLKKDELKEAKDNAPSGGALAQLEWALEAPANRKIILDQMRGLEMSKAKLEQGAKKRVTSRAILEIIDRCIATAESESGVLLPSNPESDDATVAVSQEPDSTS